MRNKSWDMEKIASALDITPTMYKYAVERYKELADFLMGNHQTGPYLISSATFPSYFLKDTELVSRSHAELDAAVFTQIARALGITHRYLGEEPTSQVTALYNQVLAERLPCHGIQCEVLPRRKAGEQPISASTVRQCIHDGDWEALAPLLPETTLEFFRSPDAADIIHAIQNSDKLIHH